MVYTNLTDLIGHTPLLKLHAVEGQKADILVKLESFNPGGSVKDRVALSMIADAEEKGLLAPGATLIEPTSGNTGVGLAWVGIAKGYKVILTMPETMSQERRNLLRAYGAELVLTPGAEGMKGAIEKAQALKDSIPGSLILGQFDNPANPAAHERTTGEEIWADTEGKLDVLVAGVGTGGTLSGTGKALKKHRADIQVVSRASAQVLSPRPITAAWWTGFYPLPMTPPLPPPVCWPKTKAFWWAFLPAPPMQEHWPWPVRMPMQEKPS